VTTAAIALGGWKPNVSLAFPAALLLGQLVYLMRPVAANHWAIYLGSSGASGYLLKSAEPEFLLAAVRTVHSGYSVIAPGSVHDLFQHAARTVSVAGPDIFGAGAALCEGTGCVPAGGEGLGQWGDGGELVCF
jgi:hypothetical protein